MDHFDKIFHKKPLQMVTKEIDLTLDRLGRLCKMRPRIRFSHDELQSIRKRWKNNKSCGPDSISHEALKVLGGTEQWSAKLLYILNDMLYVAKIPEAIERGVTILLAKKSAPADWGDTRPIALSSVLLKTFSPLITHRVAHHVQTPSRLQWSRRHRQGVELILVLHKVCRAAHDWGIPMFLAKLDIRKAFDSVYQESPAAEVARDVGDNGEQPWEAQAWVAFLKARKVCIHFRGELFEIDQSNGVRQGSPDSPIAFGRIVARELDKSLHGRHLHLDDLCPTYADDAQPTADEPSTQRLGDPPGKNGDR